MDGGDDWDLAAVVRGCCSRAKPAAAAADPLLSSVFAVEREEEKGGEQINILANHFFPDLLSRTRNFDGSEGLYNPFLIHQGQHQPEHPTRRPKGEESTLGVARKPRRPAPAQPPRSKRRKKQMKKVVCQVPADGVSSDMWAWRKYGQKPIKGSPYPRGYYRCSSFRGCPARKQVERNRTDPGQLIITYTAEHNHPVPLRHKLPSTPTLATTTTTTTTSSSVSGSALAAVQDRAEENNSKENDQLVSSPATSVSVDGDEEGELMVEDMEMIGEDELVFMGDALETGEGASSWFDDDGDGDGEGESEDRLFASPWLESGNNGSATAAAC